MRRTLGAAIVAAACCLVPASAAQAGTLTFCSSGDSAYCFGETFLTYSGQAGETNNVNISRAGDTLVLTDSGATITQPFPQSSASTCTIAADGHTATCPAPANAFFTSIRFFLGDGDDTGQSTVEGSQTASRSAIVDHRVSTTMSGADGNDHLIGSNGKVDTSEFFAGGTGNDTTDANDGNDTVVDYDSSQPVTPDKSPYGGANTQNGGGGDDDLEGGPDADTQNGGDGDDELTGDSNDVVEDANGDPVAVIPHAADVQNGGGGFDEVRYEDTFSFDANHDFVDMQATDIGVKENLTESAPARAVTTTGNGYGTENDTYTSIEDGVGTSGVDTITGSATSNVLFGLGGNDTITGGNGPDTLFGGDGDDTINSADGEADRVNCGGQVGDKANIDQVDATTGCPAVGAGTTITQVANPNIPAPDRSAPVIAVKTKKTIKLKDLKKKGLPCSVTSKDTVADRLVCTLTGKVKSAKIAAAGELIFAEKRKTFTGKTKITLKIAKKLQKALKKKKKLRLLVQVTDQAGNTTAKRIVIKIK